MALPNPFRIIAHRGASGYAPENTMAAFKRAAEMGCSDIETDVSFTKDGKLLLFHDSKLDRTTNGSGDPGDFTMDELLQLDSGSWWDPAAPRKAWEPELTWDQEYSGEKLITLEQLLDEFGDSFTYHVEIKQPTDGLVPAVLDAIRDRGLIDNVMIAAINDDASLQEAIKIEPSIRVASACVDKLKENGAKAIEECAEFGYHMVTLASFNHTRELVELGQSLGMEVRSSGISNREKMVQAVEIGANGMTINWPDWLQDHVRDM